MNCITPKNQPCRCCNKNISYAVTGDDQYPSPEKTIIRCAIKGRFIFVIGCNYNFPVIRDQLIQFSKKPAQAFYPN